MIQQLIDNLKEQELTPKSFQELSIAKKLVVYCNDSLVQPLLKQGLELKLLQQTLQNALSSPNSFEQIHQDLRDWTVKIEPRFSKPLFSDVLNYDIHPLMIAASTGKKDIFKWSLNNSKDNEILDKVMANLKVNGNYGASEADRLEMLNMLSTNNTDFKDTLEFEPSIKLTMFDSLLKSPQDTKGDSSVVIGDSDTA